MTDRRDPSDPPPEESTIDASEELHALVEQVRSEAASTDDARGEGDVPDATIDASDELRRIVADVRAGAAEPAPEPAAESAPATTASAPRWVPQGRIVSSVAPATEPTISSDAEHRHSRTPLVIAVGVAVVLAIVLVVVLLTGGDDAEAPTVTDPASSLVDDSTTGSEPPISEGTP